MWKNIAALVVGFSFGVVAVYLVTPASAQQELTIRQQVHRFMDRNTTEALAAIETAINEQIQPELNSLGSDMNATQVILAEMRSKWQVSNLLEVREDMLEGGLSAQSQAVVELDAEITALGGTVPE